jgi:putative ABC transport system permease protein
MLKNYFITAFRNFARNKIFSAINISGLAIGISAALVIYLVVQFEFSFEKFRTDKDRIYRVVTQMTFPGDDKVLNSGVPLPMPVAMRNDLTGIETAAQFVTAYELTVTIPMTGTQTPAVFKKQNGIIYADEYFFSLFDADWLAGSGQTALKDPFQVVLTEEKAKTYFGNMKPADIIGREIIYGDTVKTTVAGIIKDNPEKATDFRFKEFISFATIMATGLKDNFGGDEWRSINSASQLFVKLKKGTQPAQLITQFAGLRSKYVKLTGDEKDDTKHSLQALTDIHFSNEYDAFDQRQAHKPTLYGLLAVALFLLLLGCINFINLTTAQAMQRAKEIGIRKTLGSGKGELIGQFLTETFLFTCVAAILSILIAPWLLKIFKDFIPAEIKFSSLNQPHVWFFLAMLVVVMTLLSGLYPAFVLTKFRPVTVLKNQVHTGTAKSRKAWVRKTLTITQFVIAQFLVIATLVVSKQISYSLNKELGYKKDAIVYLNTRWNFFSKTPDNRRFTLLEKIKAIPEIEKVSLGGRPPAHIGYSSTTLKINNGKKDVELMVETMEADPDYFDIYKLKLIAGKLPAMSDTVKEYLVNESYAKAVGFSKAEDAIGKTIARGDKNIPVVGVLADFHSKSTHDIIQPIVYASAARQSFAVHIALKMGEGWPGRWKDGLDKIEKEFKKLYPDDDFEPVFYDASVAAFYKKEKDISRLLKWSAGLCIFISSLGLLGLVIFTTNTRIKEVGVRKVLGASVPQIVSLLSKDLVSLVLIAFLIATPLAWMAMNKWLSDFVYRTSISWWIFAACGAGMLIIALLVLSIRTVKAAITNPVKSLRTE